ncbi:MAG: hypothetical protein ACXVCT_20695 [Ktedonobacterales bacterium]
MTTVQDCMQEIIAKGPGYFIRGRAPAGEHVAREWEPQALLDDMRQNIPGILEDHAWTEWSLRPDIGVTCIIHYGVRGFSLGYMEVPGYGTLRVLELSQKRRTDPGEKGDSSRKILGHLLGN